MKKKKILQYIYMTLWETGWNKSILINYYIIKWGFQDMLSWLWFDMKWKKNIGFENFFKCIRHIDMYPRNKLKVFQNATKSCWL